MRTRLVVASAIILVVLGLQASASGTTRWPFVQYTMYARGSMPSLTAHRKSLVGVTADGRRVPLEGVLERMGFSPIEVAQMQWGGWYLRRFRGTTRPCDELVAWLSQQLPPRDRLRAVLIERTSHALVADQLTTSRDLLPFCGEPGAVP